MAERKRVTVAALLDAWMAHVEPRHALRTVHQNRQKIDKRIKPALGSIQIDRLKPSQLDTQCAKWRAEGLSDSTVHHLHAILSAAFRTAERWGWIDQAPTRRASPPPLRNVPMRPPTPEELQKLIRQAEPTDTVLAVAVALAALTGARRGELCALRWSDVDLGRRRQNRRRAPRPCPADHDAQSLCARSSRTRPRSGGSVWAAPGAA